MPAGPVVDGYLDTADPTTAVSDAVPVMVTVWPTGKEVPPVGVTIDETGATVSVDAVVRTSPDWIESGWMPISANRLTVACCMRGSTVELSLMWSLSSPHDHRVVPAPKTSAPLGALYKRQIVRGGPRSRGVAVVEEILRNAERRRGELDRTLAGESRCPGLRPIRSRGRWGSRSRFAPCRDWRCWYCARSASCRPRREPRSCPFDRNRPGISCPVS